MSWRKISSGFLMLRELSGESLCWNLSGAIIPRRYASLTSAAQNSIGRCFHQPGKRGIFVPVIQDILLRRENGSGKGITLLAVAAASETVQPSKLCLWMTRICCGILLRRV